MAETARKLHVNVCVRLKPLDDDSQEDSQRPVTVEQLHETSCRIAGWDDPVQFDGVFAASQSQPLYEQSCQHIPQDLCNGYHCTLVTYGASQSGKTHTLFDDNQGLVPNLVQNIFVQLQSIQPTECIIQCSIVELYLESIRDLLGDTASDEARIHRGSLVGCAALSCISAEDVFGLLKRAHSIRTAAYDATSRHSSKSTFVMQLTLQIAAASGDNGRRIGRLLLVDCSPSQYYSGENNEQEIKSEPMQALHAYIQERLEVQQLQQEQYTNGPTLSQENMQKLPLVAQMLSYSLGSNCVASVVVCVSPQQAVSEQSLRFGLDCRKLVNLVSPNTHHAWQDCVEFQSQTVDRMDKLETVTRALAEECIRLRSKAGNYLVDRTLWSMIDEISVSSKEGRPLDFMVETKAEHEQKRDTMRLRSELRRAEEDRDKAIAKAANVQADLANLMLQATHVHGQYQEQTTQLEALKAENDALKQRKLEVERNMRTSLFRESEAVVFLRQFRKFYFRLLQKMAKEGTGDVDSILKGIPGAPDLDHMVDIDRAMVASGLLEEEEVGKDKALKDHRPTRAALMRSSKAVTDAESILLDETNGQGHISGIGGVNLSVVSRGESGETTEARQRLFQTPSGRYIEMRERKLEEDILELTGKFTKVAELLELEKASVAALKNVDGAAERIKVAQELKSLQDTLKRKEKDWQAVILKMNELHLSSKDARDKVNNREQHVAYLESTLAESQKQHSQLIVEHQATMSRLRCEAEDLRKQVNQLHSPVWQYEELESKSLGFARRVVVPFCPGDGSLLANAEKRTSCGQQETWIDLYFKPRMEVLAAAAAASSSLDDRRAQTNAHSSTSRPLSKPATPEARVVSLLFMNDDDKDDEQSADQSEEDAPDSKDDGLRSSSHYGSLVDAYEIASEAEENQSFSGTNNESINMDSNRADLDPLSTHSAHAMSSESAPVLEPRDLGEKPKSSILERLQARAKVKAEAEAKASIEGGDDGVPEWMRKFKTIGAKNANAEVIETQGAAGIREFGRTPWETLKLHDRKTTDATEIFATTTVQWAPRPKRGSDSDSDSDHGYSGYSPYIGGTPVVLPSSSSSDNEDTTETDGRNDNSTMEDKENAETEPESVSAFARKKDSDSDDSSSEDEKPKSASMTAPAPAPAPMPVKKGTDSDSDSDTESKPNERSAPMPAPAPPPAPTKKGSDSDSDSSQGSKPNQPVAPLPAKPKTSPADSDADSDSSEDPKPKKFPPPKLMVAKKDNNDSDSDSSEESKPTASIAHVKPPAPSKQNDSDSDSSEESKPQKPSAPLLKAPAKMDSDSDSDDSKPKKPAAPARKAPPEQVDSDSDSASSERLTQRTNPAPAPPAGAAKNDSDSDSDSSEDAKPKKRPAPAKKASVKKIDSSDESSDDGFGGWTKPTQKTIGGDTQSISTNDETKSVSSAKDKAKFVIMNGKLVKADSTGDLNVNANTEKKPKKEGGKKTKKAISNVSTAKPAFVIVNGKLVKADDVGGEKKGKKKKDKEEKEQGKKKKKGKPKD